MHVFGRCRSHCDPMGQMRMSMPMGKEAAGLPQSPSVAAEIDGSR